MLRATTLPRDPGALATCRDAASSGSPTAIPSFPSSTSSPSRAVPLVTLYIHGSSAMSTVRVPSLQRRGGLRGKRIAPLLRTARRLARRQCAEVSCWAVAARFRHLSPHSAPASRPTPPLLTPPNTDQRTRHPRSQLSRRPRESIERRVHGRLTTTPAPTTPPPSANATLRLEALAFAAALPALWAGQRCCVGQEERWTYSP